MTDLHLLSDLAAGGRSCPAPVIFTAGVLRSLERSQGTAMMLSTVLAALGYGALLTGRGPFMADYLNQAAQGLLEDIQDMQRQGQAEGSVPAGFETDMQSVIRMAEAIQTAQADDAATQAATATDGRVINLSAFRNRGQTP